MTGANLDGEKVTRARWEEPGEVRKHKVYAKVPISKCIRATGKKPIGTRWIDISKGDGLHPDYRPRLAAKESALDKWEDLSAGTPSLEAKKLLPSMALTKSYDYDQKRQSRSTWIVHR